MESIFTKKLGLFGWNKFEPLLLAGLTNELPILLIGKHGSAKSYLLERLSIALKMNYKFYNASLIDYDDLVGIPVPTEDKKSLTYIKTDTAIWDAEVVFVDEINRTKPELQNKLFPIIYEKRVQGQNLTKLKYRWAAMNPSYDDENSYLGTMPLDDALADRFGFIIDVPSWDELNEEERNEILLDQYNLDSYLDLDLLTLVNETKKEYEHQKEVLKETSNEITLNLMKVLHKKFGYFSARRATIIKDALIAVHASRIILNKHSEKKEKISFDETIYLTIPYVLPNRANDKIDEESLYRGIKTVVETLNLDKVSTNFMLMDDPVKKLIYGFKHIEEISHIVVLESLPTLIKPLNDEDKLLVSYLINLKLKEYPDAPAAIVETFFKLSNDFYEIVKKSSFHVGRRKDSTDYEYIKEIQNEEDSLMNKRRYNFLITISNEFGLLRDDVIRLDNKFVSLYKELIND